MHPPGFQATVSAMMRMRSLPGIWLLTLLCLSACGGGASSADAGTGGDADGGDGDGSGSGSGGQQRPRSDNQVGGDPIVQCDRFDSFACGPGQKCALLIRRAPEETDYLVQTGCVDVPKERPVGAICTPWGDEHTFEGLGEEVYLDPCAQGLVCSDDPAIDGLHRCQPACQSGRYQDRGLYPSLCDDPGSYCSSVPPIPRPDSQSHPLLEWCIRAADCDPGAADSCGEGLGCYARLGDNAGAVLTECYVAPDAPTTDFEPCEYINECAPGSHCWGPVRIPPAEWTGDQRRCRPACVPGAGGDEDAGTGDEDAGVGPDNGGCPAGTACRAFSESELSLGAASGSLGQCE